MKLRWTKKAWEDYIEWSQKNPQLAERIDLLIISIKQNPFSGIGKPEPLRFKGESIWSRRINKQHRLIYSVYGKIEKKGKQTIDNRVLAIYQCYGHYDD